jgi:uncharacterized protein YndB with AHSA1/START domain
MTMAATQDTVLRLERLIATSPDHLFGLWTKPEMIVQWFGPDGYDVPSHDIDVRPGGTWSTTMRAPDGSLHTVSGVYRVIDPPRKLVFTWAWNDDKGERGHETEVTVTFAAAPGGTRLTLVQQQFESADSRDRHSHGWNSSFACLERLAK